MTYKHFRQELHNKGDYSHGNWAVSWLGGAYVVYRYDVYGQRWDTYYATPSIRKAYGIVSR